MAQMNWKSKSEKLRNEEIRELKTYLQETDFYYLRKFETGQEVPVDVKERRKESRKRLKELGL